MSTTLGNQPPEYFGEEQSPHLSAAYAYVIQHDDGTQQYFTGTDQIIVMENIPTAVVPAGTATFLPGQIQHGKITSNDRFENRGVTMSITSEDQRLRRFFTMAAAVKLKAWIIRISQERLEGTVDFTKNALIVESGILAKFGFSGMVVSCELTPEPYFVDRSIPRFFCEKTCNHPLYGPGCNLDKEDWKFATKILSVDRAERLIVVEGQKADVDENWFQAGHFKHDVTKLFFAIAWSEHVGPDTRLKLAYWHPELAINSTLTAYAGCRHTVEDCAGKFENEANFGGFPFVPNRNPVTNGVG